MLGERIQKNFNNECNSTKLIQTNIPLKSANLLPQVSHLSNSENTNDVNFKTSSNENLNNNKKDTKLPQITVKMPLSDTRIQNNFNCPSVNQNSADDNLIKNSSDKDFKLGEQVNIDLSFEVVQSLQVGHGGWCEAMFEVTLILLFDLFSLISWTV